MHFQRLELVRQTKLDVAQWITLGIATCGNPATAMCLARYAAAQLESAALIPRTAGLTARQVSGPSLLRAELKKSSSSAEAFVTLTRVSRAMISLIAGNSPRERNRAMKDAATAALIRRELQAARLLANTLPRKAAA